MLKKDGLKLEPISRFSKAKFPVDQDYLIDLFSVFHELKLEFGFEHCRYDETFKPHRIVLRHDDYTLTIYHNGRVMIYGLFDEEKVAVFLNEIWCKYLNKTVRNPKCKLK